MAPLAAPTNCSCSTPSNLLEPILLFAASWSVVLIAVAMCVLQTLCMIAVVGRSWRIARQVDAALHMPPRPWWDCGILFAANCALAPARSPVPMFAATVGDEAVTVAAHASANVLQDAVGTPLLRRAIDLAPDDAVAPAFATAQGRQQQLDRQSPSGRNSAERPTLVILPCGNYAVASSE